MVTINIRGLKFKPKKALHWILDGIDLDLAPAQCTVLVGTSGSGKTTLLKCIAHLYPDYEGNIFVNDQELHRLKPAERVALLGFVAQQWNLFPHMTIWQHCIHPQQHVLKRTLVEAEANASMFLKQLGISHLKDRKPHQLSGGQQQRAAIARALVMGSQVLLLDEPTSALDPQTTEDFCILLKELQTQGLTLLLTSHDKAVVNHVADTVVLMEAGKISKINS